VTNIALIGGSGFIGSNLAKFLVSCGGYRVNSFDLNDDKLHLSFENNDYSFEHLDIRDSGSELDRVVTSADVVVNLAAHVRPGHYILKPLEIVDLNLFSSMPIIEACVKHKKFLLHFSTCEVYGKSGGNTEPFKEDKTDCILGPITNHRWIYSNAKQLLDRIIHAHGQAGDLDYVIVRPFNVVGPLMDDVVPHWTREDNPRVLANFMSALIYNRPMQLVNGGRSRRCFTYVEDALIALELLIRRRHDVNRQIVNIGNPANETTIADLATRLLGIYRAHCDPDVDVPIEDVSAEEFYGSGYEDCDRRVPDISKLKRLGWTPRYDLDETFTRSAVYFYENRERLESLLQRDEHTIDQNLTRDFRSSSKMTSPASSNQRDQLRLASPGG
jgi:UDP-apiose/xylose synthase